MTSVQQVAVAPLMLIFIMKVLGNMKSTWQIYKYMNFPRKISCLLEFESNDDISHQELTVMFLTSKELFGKFI